MYSIHYTVCTWRLQYLYFYSQVANLVLNVQYSIEELMSSQLCYLLSILLASVP